MCRGEGVQKTLGLARYGEGMRELSRYEKDNRIK